jgi:alkyl hydroperoxide reductase subunit AhpC
MLIEEFVSVVDQVFILASFFSRFISNLILIDVGRNWYEILRQFDSLMMTIYHPIACPANWAQGQQVLIKRDVSTQDAADYRCVEIKPWFRLAPCPEKI